MISWIMEVGGRYAAFVVDRPTKETHLKPPIATGIESHSMSYSEHEKTASYFTTSSMQNKLWLFKNIIFSRP